MQGCRSPLTAGAAVRRGQKAKRASFSAASWTANSSPRRVSIARAGTRTAESPDQEERAAEADGEADADLVGEEAEGQDAEALEAPGHHEEADNPAAHVGGSEYLDEGVLTVMKAKLVRPTKPMMTMATW